MRSMAGFFRRCGIGLIPLMSAALLLAGCGSVPFSYKGGVVPESFRIPLAAGGEHTGRWQTEDLVVDYRYVRTQDNFKISGSITFADRLKFNFTRIDTFHADLIFSDAQGAVLQASGLTTSVTNAADEPELFSRQIVLPPHAAFMAFSYRGQARSPDSEGDGVDMYFWEYPIR